MQRLRRADGNGASNSLTWAPRHRRVGRCALTQRNYELPHQAVLSDLVVKYQELVLVYQRREQDFAMYSHRIAKIFKRLAEKASPEDAAFAGRCVSPAVDISMETYADSQAAANSKLKRLKICLKRLLGFLSNRMRGLSKPYKFFVLFHAMSHHSCSGEDVKVTAA